MAASFIVVVGERRYVRPGALHCPAVLEDAGEEVHGEDHGKRGDCDDPRAAPRLEGEPDEDTSVENEVCDGPGVDRKDHP